MVKQTLGDHIKSKSNQKEKPYKVSSKSITNSLIRSDFGSDRKSRCDMPGKTIGELCITVFVVDFLNYA